MTFIVGRFVRHILTASADEISVGFISLAPAPLVAPRNIVPAGEKEPF